MEEGPVGRAGRNVLFMPHYLGSLETTLLPLALEARDRLKLRPVFLLRYDDDGVSQALLDKEQIAWERIHPTSIDEEVARLRTGTPAVNPFRYVRTVRGQITSNRLKKKLAVEILDRFTPAAIFVVGEYPYFEAFLLHEANERGVPNVLVQWTDTGRREHFDEEHRMVRDNQLRGHGILVRMVARLKDVVSKNVIYKVLGRGYGGLPRFLGDGNAAKFAVMGPEYGEMFLSQGVPGGKVCVTGHPNHDHMYRLRQSAVNEDFQRNIKEKYGLPLGLPLIVVGGDDMSQWKAVSPNKDKANMRAVMEELVRLSEGSAGYGILLKPHPRIERGYYDFLKTEFPGVVIRQDADLAELIAVARVYIAQASSTLGWALALGTAVISYDFDNLEEGPLGGGWSTMRHLLGIVCVEDIGEFRGAVESMLQNEKRREQLRAEGYTTATRRMVLDGGSTERILALAGLVDNSGGLGTQGQKDQEGSLAGNG